MRKTIAIIQARLGSTRLPRKVFIKLEGKTVLEHVVARVKASRLVDEVIVATTNLPRDNEIVELCVLLGVRVYAGSENDVLDRYYQAAKPFNSGNTDIVRITADCPLIDPAVIDKVIELHLKAGADYTTNTLSETFPDGEDVEVFTFSALEKAWKCARLGSEREHVTPYIKNNRSGFKVSDFKNGADLSDLRWTLDEDRDAEFIKAVYQKLYNNNNLFGVDDILECLVKYPELKNLNKGIVRNAGYLKSLNADKCCRKETE
jgi:spore coat polysaccharide biosynthesis protein SpsF (cytidylyltransferase family)